MRIQEHSQGETAVSPSKPAYRQCSRCVMDTSDPDIRFDAGGVCNHCHTYDAMIARHARTGAQARAELDGIVAAVRRDGKRRAYDCVIGVSGGVDSTYVAYAVKKLGLRPLAVHLDNGWNSELAVANIERCLKALNIPLYTWVLDWEEFRDLQLAFLKASTPDSEIPSDHAIFAALRIMARRMGVKYVLAGINVRTESHLPAAWSQGHLDWRYIRAIHQQFGTVPLHGFPHMSLSMQLYYRLTQRWVNVLNYLDYSKTRAMETLKAEVGWRYYGGKHYESIYTRFYQGYILPKKFGYDKRRCHLSSLICSGEITRSAALRELEAETYPPELQREDLEYVAKKFSLSVADFEEVLRRPPRRYADYPSYATVYRSRGYALVKKAYWACRRAAGSV